MSTAQITFNDVDNNGILNWGDEIIVGREWAESRTHMGGSVTTYTVGQNDEAIQEILNDWQSYDKISLLSDKSFRLFSDQPDSIYEVRHVVGNEEEMYIFDTVSVPLGLDCSAEFLTVGQNDELINERLGEGLSTLFNAYMDVK